MLIDDLVENIPNNLKVSMLNAELLRLKSKDPEALKIYKNLINENPKYSPAWFGLAKVYQLQGKNNLAEQSYLRSVNSQRTWFSLNELAIFYYQTGQLEKAEKIYLELSEIAPENNVVLQTLGAIQFSKNDFNKAFQTFSHALEISPTAVNYSNVATVLFYRKDYLGAVKNFEAAVNLNPGHAVLLGNLADSYRWAGLEKKSIEYYKMAIIRVNLLLKDKPESDKLVLRKALYLAKLGNKKEARINLDKVNNLADNNMLIMAAQVSELCGERTLAVKYINAALNSGYEFSSILNEPEFSKLLQDKRENFLP